MIFPEVSMNCFEGKCHMVTRMTCPVKIPLLLFSGFPLPDQVGDKLRGNDILQNNSSA